MRQVTGSMAAVVKNMDRAMQDMNLERVRRASFVSLSLKGPPADFHPLGGHRSLP